MDTDETYGKSGRALNWLRETFTSLRNNGNSPSPIDDKTTFDIPEDGWSDSGSDNDDNSKNVATWLESLPIDQHWCEAEEQIPRMEDSPYFDGYPGIGDTECPIATKEKSESRKRSQISEQLARRELFPEGKKYRRGTLRVSTKVDKKKGKSCSDNAVKKKTALSTEVLLNEKEEDYSTEVKGPIFDKPEIARALDDSMSRAIKKYKRNDRTWDSVLSDDILTRGPPNKRSKP